MAGLVPAISIGKGAASPTGMAATRATMSTGWFGRFSESQLAQIARADERSASTGLYFRSDHRVDRGAVADEIRLRDDELPKRRLDRVEIDIGDEAIDRGVDAGRLRAEDEALRRDEIGDDRKVREAARVSRGRVEAA